MTRVILWKEVREQAQVVITLLVLAACGIVLASTSGLTTRGDRGLNALALAGVFAWVSGLVAGAQLLAGEHENQTQPWLDILPVTRRRLWWRKTGAGVAIALMQAVVVWLALLLRYLLGGDISTNVPADYFALSFVFLLLLTTCGFAGGLFGSAFARTTLGAIGWGLLVEVVVIPAGVLIAVLVRESAVLICLWCISLSLAVLIPAGRRYSLPDRLRLQSIRVLTAAGPATRRVMLWLAWRQGRGVYWFLLLAGIALAAVVRVSSPLVWPLAGALLAAIAGLMAYTPDQNASAYRMFGDRRSPVGGIWVWKLALPMAVVGVAIVLLALNLLLRYLVVDATNSTSARDEFQRDVLWLRSGLSFATLVLGPLYGFACGQFFGLIYRKTVVAAVMALVSSLGAVLLWLPSITLGGLHVWQWLVPPVVLLVASRTAMWPWVTGRIGTLRTAAGLVAACLLAALSLAAGVAYRVVELPAPAAFDQRAAQHDLYAEYTWGARLVTQAIGEFAAHVPRAEAKLGPPVEGGGAPGVAPPAGAPAIEPGLLAPPGLPPRIVPDAGVDLRPEVAAAGEPPEPPKDWDTRAIEAIDNGWPAKDEVLSRWLDELARGDWWATLKAAVGHRAGAYPDRIGMDYAMIDYARRMGLMLAARSLQLQKQGDYEAALQPLEMALTLTSNLQSFANGHQLSIALVVERQALAVLGEWTQGVGARPELLRRALAAARANDFGQAPMQAVVDVEFYRTMHTSLPPWQYEGARNDFERALVPIAGAVSWEAERHRRFVEGVREGYVRYAALDFRTAAAAFGSRPHSNDANLGHAILWRWVGKTGQVASQDEVGESLIHYVNNSPWLKDAPMVFVPELSLWYNVQTQLNGSIIRQALMLYQCDQGDLRDSLDVLVPKYLPSLPSDPYSRGPFHFHVTYGRPIRTVHYVGGSAVYRDAAARVWSVGPDLKDDGGRVMEPNTDYKATVADSDVLFIVPWVKKP